MDVLKAFATHTCNIIPVLNRGHQYLGYYELADIMELDLKKRIEDLSYGNKKKVGIVQGLLHSPKLIVLDEPTSGLDPNQLGEIRSLISRIAAAARSIMISL